MKIQEYLVWDKNTGELIRYVDLGDPELTYTTVKNAGTVASHVLVFLICGIVNPIKFSLANFISNIKCTINSAVSTFLGCCSYPRG